MSNLTTEFTLFPNFLPRNPSYHEIETYLNNLNARMRAALSLNDMDVYDTIHWVLTKDEPYDEIEPREKLARMLISVIQAILIEPISHKSFAKTLPSDFAEKNKIFTLLALIKEIAEEKKEKDFLLLAINVLKMDLAW